mgnify:CR=1 FL=1
MTQQDLADLYFNSIKVQLRRLSTALAGEQSVFQFHKGTIKTPIALGYITSLFPIGFAGANKKSY